MGTYSRFSKPQLQATYRSTLIQQHPSQQCLDILLNNMVVLSSTDHLSLNKVMDILLNNNLCTSRLHHLNKLLPRRTVAVSTDAWQPCVVVGFAGRHVTAAWTA